MMSLLGDTLASPCLYGLYYRDYRVHLKHAFIPLKCTHKKFSEWQGHKVEILKGNLMDSLLSNQWQGQAVQAQFTLPSCYIVWLCKWRNHTSVYRSSYLKWGSVLSLHQLENSLTTLTAETRLVNRRNCKPQEAVLKSPRIPGQSQS